MKRKWWIVGILVFLELLVCAAILLTLWTGRAAFEAVRFFYTTDTNIEETVEKNFAVDGPAALDLEAVSGNATVTGVAGDEVQVIARLHLWGSDKEDARRQIQVPMTQEGNRITVREERPEYGYIFAFATRGSWVDFEIRVPSETSLQLGTSSGDLAVSGVTGTVELQTTSGNIRAEEVNGAVSAQSSSGDVTLIGLSGAGNLEASTISGDLELRDIAADSLTAHTSSGQILVESGTLSDGLDLETTSGDVTVMGLSASSSGDLTLDGCSGPLNARTISGKIEVSNARKAELALATSSGEILFSGSLDDQGEHRVESVSGDVRLVLPADAAFDLDVETVSGSIQTEFAVTMTEFDNQHVAGKVNGGGPLLRINTSSGDVTLESATVESK